MKKFIGVLSFCLLGLHASSQIDAGTIITGGFASFNNRSYASGGESTTTLSLQPQFGLAFADNFVAGAWFMMSSLKNVNSWSISPFVRYYMKNFFVQGGYGYSYAKSGEVKSEGSIIDFELGYAAFLNDYVALEPALYYNGTFNGGKYSYTDVGIKLGFQIYLNRD